MYPPDDEGAPVSPRVLEWTPERAELVKVYEAIEALTGLVSSALGGPQSPTQPQPRPVTASDRLAKKLQDAAYDALIETIDEARAAGG